MKRHFGGYAWFLLAVLTSVAIWHHFTDPSGKGDAALPPSAQESDLDGEVTLPPVGSVKQGTPLALTPSPSRRTNGDALAPEGTPLLAMEAELIARLHAGDVRAGCRLHLELARCHTQSVLQEMTQGLMERAAHEEAGDAEINMAVDVTAYMDDRLARTRDICAGVGKTSYRRYHDVLLRTARLGDTRAMVQYADSAGSLQLEFAREPERLMQWRDTAESMLYEALQKGEPAALFALHVARTSDTTLLGALLDDDPIEAAALAMVLQRLNSAMAGTAHRLQRQLDARELAEAEAMADRLHAAYFAHLPPETRQRARLDAADPDVAYCDTL